MIRALKYIALIFWIELTFLYMFRMWKISIASSNIDRYYQTQQDIKDLTLENNLLENEIAKQSSLRIIEQEASRAGFSEVKKVEWIK